MSNSQVLKKEFENSELSEEDLNDVPLLIFHLLSFFSSVEHKSPLEIFNEINRRRNPSVDIVSACLVFAISYLNFYMHGKENMENIQLQ